MATRNFVAYYRVRTKKQGDSSIGLEAQKEMVTRHLNGGDWKLVAEYTEVESGTRKDKDRPKLKEAFEACKLYGATLVIAKLDRLYRSVYMTAKLMESGVDFVACDVSTANRFTIHILAAVAEDGASKTSKRTKEALDAKKRRGEPTGGACWKDRSGVLSAENQEKGRSIAIARIKSKANEFAALVQPVINRLSESGMSLNKIAAELNNMSVPTPRGSQWTAQAVKNVIARHEADFLHTLQRNCPAYL